MIGTGDLPLAAATGVVTVNLGALKRNWQSLARLVAPAECAAVVKANAYGTGASRAIPALAAAGCRTFFVATVFEAAEARALAPDATVYVLDGLLPGAGPTLLAACARPILSNLGEVTDWVALARAHGARLPCALQLETGLNRLGLTADDLSVLVSDPTWQGHADVKLILTHLASGDVPGDAQNEAQRRVFETLSAHFSTAPRSLAASAGVMLGRSYHYDLARPGYALYGGQPLGAARMPVEPVVSVTCRVLQVHDVPAGEAIGYNATYHTDRPKRIATIAAGYADGFFRHASAARDAAGGVVAIGGQLAPVVGRVSMDLVTVDVTDFAQGKVTRGTEAELIGSSISLEDVGRRAGSTGYEVLTRLSPRLARVYTSSEA